MLFFGQIEQGGYMDVAIASVHSEKTWAKKWIMIIIIIINKSQELTVFHGRQKMTSAMKEPPEVGLVKKLTGSLY